MSMDLQEVYLLAKPIADHWGEELTPLILAEECGELEQAVSKYYRYLYFAGEKSLKKSTDVADEIGDVLLMIFAMCWLCEISVDEVIARVRYKGSLKKDGAL